MQWSYLESFQDSPSPYLKKKSVTTPTKQKVCTEGQKYNPSTNECVDCEVGTYQDATNHTLTSCKPHIEPVCDIGSYLDTATYTERKNATKDSTVNLDGLCLEHDSLEDLRKQCSSGYILDTDYDEKINTMKKTPLTSAAVCKPHTTWDTKTTLGTCNEKQYYDRRKYNDTINKEKSRNITFDEICLTIPYYPLNVKAGDDNYIAKPNLKVLLKENGKYLDIQSLNDELNLIYSDNAKSIPITWNKETNKILLTETTPIKYYAKVVDNKIKFVEESNELSVDMRNGKLFVTGTNIEIVVNNCEDNNYLDNQSGECIPKTNSCGQGTFFSGYGNSDISNDPRCKPKTTSCTGDFIKLQKSNTNYENNECVVDRETINNAKRKLEIKVNELEKRFTRATARFEGMLSSGLQFGYVYSLIDKYKKSYNAEKKEIQREMSRLSAYDNM